MSAPDQPLASVHKLPPRSTKPEVEVIHPRSYEDARRVGDILRSASPVIISLEGAEADLAKRVIAFACGLVYALDGNLQKLERGVYLLSPRNAEVWERRADKGRQNLGF